MQMGGQAMVATCKVTECSYNQQEMCCAPNITVGDMHPQCDTFTTSGASQTSQEESHVGNCKVQDCTFNESMNCKAPGITVAHHADHADCETYRKS
jgi:hypothetical protein